MPWIAGEFWPIVIFMDSLPNETGTRTEMEVAQRAACEAAAISAARAEFDAGQYVDSAEIGAWIASIGTASELPPPQTRRR